MPIAAFQFDTFQSIASDVGEASWSNPGNGQESDNAYAAALLSSFSAAVVTEYLVCTGADLSALPRNIRFTKIEVNIEAQGANSELFEILGCESDGSGGLTLGGLNLLRAAGAGPIDLTGSDTVYPRGRNNWNFWWRDRLQNPDFGVAIRARLKQGQFSGTVSIDHVELVVHYETFVKPFVRKDTRPVMEVKVAGTTSRSGLNEGGEAYQPGVSPPSGEHDWHESDESADFMHDVIDVRTATGAQRLCLRMPAGRIQGQELLASSQWEPMFDHQRDALIEVIGSWVAGDPEREVSIYLGGWLPPDPGRIDMEGYETPDVSDPEHVTRLQRTYFPYRDFVGVRRFILDNTSAINKANTLALFQWARENGMEFVYEAIPRISPPSVPLDFDRLGKHNAYALTRFCEDNEDELHPWYFERGDCTVLMRPNDAIPHEGMSRAEYMRHFSRAGYALQVHDTLNVPDPPEGYFALDGDAMAVGPMYEQRRCHHVTAYPVAFPVARSARHLFSGEQRHGREGAFRALSHSVAIPIAHPVAFDITGT